MPEKNEKQFGGWKGRRTMEEKMSFEPGEERRSNGW